MPVRPPRRLILSCSLCDTLIEPTNPDVEYAAVDHLLDHHRGYLFHLRADALDAVTTGGG